MMTFLAGLEFCLVLFLATSSQGYDPESTPARCSEPIRKICEALRKEDAGLRVEEGRKVIREALFPLIRECATLLFASCPLFPIEST